MAAAAASAALWDTYKQAAIAGGCAGAILGFTGGGWLVLFQGGRWAGAAVTWLWVTVLIIAGCLAFVAFS
jgi:hypothetical protein